MRAKGKRDQGLKPGHSVSGGHEDKEESAKYSSKVASGKTRGC